MVPSASPRNLGWRDSIVLALAAALIAVPAVALAFFPKPSRFGFQMFSGYGVVTASYHDREGVEHGIRVQQYVVVLRHEIDWTADLPGHLCSLIPEAVSVEVTRTQPQGAERGTASC